MTTIRNIQFFPDGTKNEIYTEPPKRKRSDAISPETIPVIEVIEICSEKEQPDKKSCCSQFCNNFTNACSDTCSMM